jgi:hypothetical protein
MRTGSKIEVSEELYSSIENEEIYHVKFVWNQLFEHTKLLELTPVFSKKEEEDKRDIEPLVKQNSRSSFCCFLLVFCHIYCLVF